MNTPNHSPSDDDISPGEIVAWAEFACWTALLLFPFLRWVNGPSVSFDQRVVRTALVVIAAVGAIGIRGVKLLRAKSGNSR